MWKSTCVSLAGDEMPKCAQCGKPFQSTDRRGRITRYRFCSRRCWLRRAGERAPAEHDPDLRFAAKWAQRTGQRVPFICAASEKERYAAQLALTRVGCPSKVDLLVRAGIDEQEEVAK